MQNLLNYSLQLTFYLYGGLALLLSFKCFLSSSKYASIFFISFIVSTIIGYFFKALFYNDKFKNLLFIYFFNIVCGDSILPDQNF